ncbi:unnamed protein product [Ixodes persulcatus]
MSDEPGLGCRQASWIAHGQEAPQPPPRAAVARQGLQEGPPGHSVEGQSFRRRLARQGHRARESGRGSQAAQLGHPQVCPSPAHQERQEDHSLRAPRRLSQLH